MHCKITKERLILEAFAVAFVPALNFPDCQQPKDGVHMKALIAANDDGGSWGWVTLSEAEKNTIGDEMINHDVPMNEWRWCELYKEDIAKARGGI